MRRVNLWLAVGLAAMAVLPTALTQSPGPAERAQTALQQKHWEEARALATEALAAEPTSADAHRIQGWAFYGLKQYREALDAFAQTLRLDPQDADAALGAGRCHRLLKEYDAAVTDFTRAHALAPNSPRPLCERGAILILQEKYDASLADYEAAKKLDPGYPGLYSYFAEIYLYRREPEKALAAVREGEKREPNLLIYKVNEAHSELFLGDMTQAKTLYLANKERVDSGKGITFAQIVLTDFRLMRAAGITHPGMDEIETLMRTP